MSSCCQDCTLFSLLVLQRLQEEQVSLTQRRDAFGQLLEEMNQEYEALKTKLQENETHAQVSRVLVHDKQTDSSDSAPLLTTCLPTA